jgi:hypothetical protein
MNTKGVKDKGERLKDKGYRIQDTGSKKMHGAK